MINLKKIIAKKPRLLNLFQLGRGWAPAPLFYLVHLTLSCNARCYFCYQKADNFEAKDKEYSKMIEVDDFEKILKEARSFLFVRPLIHLFGGEPLLHPQFGKILELIEKYKFSYSLTTNGILFGKYLERIGSSRNLKQINVSLYGEGDVHDDIVGHSGVFDDIMDNVGRISREFGKKGVVNFNVVIIKENQSRCLELANFLNKKFTKGEIGALVFQYSVEGDVGQMDRKFLESIEEIKKKQLNFDVLFTAGDWVGHDASLKTSFEKGNCNLPWLGLGILPNLDVLPGGSILTCSQVLGSLKTKKIGQIWNGVKLRSLRKQILRGLPMSCRGCCHAQLARNKNKHRQK